jgi:hypothetical protein
MVAWSKELQSNAATICESNSGKFTTDPQTEWATLALAYYSV